MKTLFAKLSTALLMIVVLIGTSFLIVVQFSTRLYYEEITQRLNSSIAMYVTEERQLIDDGVVNTEALSLLAQQAMIINPTVEAYLLDTQGAILAHALPPESMLTDRVDLAPVHALLAGDVDMPLRGTDPRNLDRQKVFSAHPVVHNGVVQGYLYAVLGGQKYDELADSIRGSYIQKLTFGALVAIVSGAFLVGWLVFGLLTRRLTRLTSDVRRFSEADFDATMLVKGFDASVGDGPVRRRRDEIGQLGAAFAAMANKIYEQFEGLNETDRLRRELVSNVSHDLRTPLASMHGYVETLLIKNDILSTHERKRYLEIARKHTQHLTRLVEDLFELSKLDSASVHPSLEYFSLAELLQDVTQEFELEAGKKDIMIEVSSRPETSTVYADIALMQRVLENLIRNALKYTPKGGSISISLDKRSDSVAVMIADTGCGIAKEDLSRVFDRFYRSEHHDGDSSTSAGLGLAIVRRILDLHGSRITVTSEVNEGTCFEFELPSNKAA
ncbi:MAG: ATP-binding protein [Gammaproteobacteria bacterium]|nr:ATP-binding protein [Gammaproteobacteria bacterium]MDH3767112.1 ATP-binding protein [Gammaproteobacteria bacterium]